MAPALRRLLWSVPLTITFTDVVASVIRVDGASMQPTLNPKGAPGCDWVLVEKWSVKALHRYTRGDVVVLWAPDAPHQQIVKRLVALQGDTVAVLQPGRPEKAVATTVPEGRCWIEGDNARASLDSRSAYGPVHTGLLEGRALYILWPPHRAGPVPARLPQGRLLHRAGDGEGAAVL